MPTTPQNNPTGGVWPLGFIKVLAPGTVKNLNLNVGTQKGKFGAARVRQIIFSTPGGASGTPNNGNIYIIYKTGEGGNDRTDLNNTILVIPPGQQNSLPHGHSLDAAKLGIESFVIDADVANDGVFVSAVY